MSERNVVFEIQQMNASFLNICSALIAFLAASVLLPQADASASCLIPVGDAVYSNDQTLGVSSGGIHSYTEGSALYIHQFKLNNSCRFCETGKYHTCQAGYWRPTYQDCSADQAVQPISKSGIQSKPIGANNFNSNGGGARVWTQLIQHLIANRYAMF